MGGLWHGIHSLRYNPHPSQHPPNLIPICSNKYYAGYDQGVFSGIVENDDFLATMNRPNDSLEGIIVSIYNLGCFAGCIVNFLLGDWLGRRRAMWFAMVWVIVCHPILCTSVM